MIQHLTDSKNGPLIGGWSPGRKPIYNSEMPESAMPSAADFPAIIV